MYPCPRGGNPAWAGYSMKLGLCCCSCSSSGAGWPNLSRELPINTTNKPKHPASCQSFAWFLEPWGSSFCVALAPLGWATSSSPNLPLRYVVLSTRLRTTSPNNFLCCVLVDSICFPGGHGVRWCGGGAERDEVRKVPSPGAGPGPRRCSSWCKPLPWGACCTARHWGSWAGRDSVLWRQSRCPLHVCLIWQVASHKMFLPCYLVSARDVKRREPLPEMWKFR